MSTIRDQIEPRLRKKGIAPTCEAAGLPRTTVMRWLAGTGDLTLTQAEALARELGLTLKAVRARSEQ